MFNESLAARRVREEWEERQHAKYLTDVAERNGLIEIDITFDGPPGPEAGRFIDVHDTVTGESISWGKWLDNGDGTWSLMGVAVRGDPSTAAEGRET